MIRTYRGKKYKRMGECKKCGKCCEMSLGIKILRKRKLKDGRNLILDAKIVKEKAMVLCVSYDKKKKECMIHDEYRPELCTQFPYCPRLSNQLKRKGIKCGYWWKALKEVKE